MKRSNFVKIDETTIRKDQIVSYTFSSLRSINDRVKTLTINLEVDIKHVIHCSQEDYDQFEKDLYSED